MATLYTVYRCRSKSSNEQRGKSHHSDYAETTLCGLKIDDSWYVQDNTFSGVATCPECQRIDENTIAPQRAKERMAKRWKA